MPTSTADDHDPRLFAGGEPGKLDRHAELRLGPDALGQIHRHAERVRRLVDGEPGNADGAARHALRVHIERTPQGGEHIGAGAPILADGERQLGGAGFDLGRRGGEQLVADHGERDFACGTRRHGHRHGVARAVLRLVEGDLEQVRRIGACLGVPARIEAEARLGPLRVGARDFEPVAAPGHRHRDTAGLVGGNVDACRRPRAA